MRVETPYDGERPDRTPSAAALPLLESMELALVKPVVLPIAAK